MEDGEQFGFDDMLGDDFKVALEEAEAELGMLAHWHATDIDLEQLKKH